MRQILLNARGALVARMPRPALERGAVLVRVRYSVISVGTELAALAPSNPSGATTAAGRARDTVRTASRYLGLAARQPAKAIERALAIARERLTAASGAASVVPSLSLDGISWTRAAAREVSTNDGRVTVLTDDSDASYQVLSQGIAVTPDRVPVIHVRGRVSDGPIAIGLLNDTRDRWLGTRTYAPGEFMDRLIFDTTGSHEVTLVVAAAGARRSCRLELESVDVVMAPPVEDGLPQSELDHQGWNVGYSAAGEVLEVGEGVSDLRPGDLVACAGAGVANHAEFVVVPRNLACRVPPGCPLDSAAAGTIGAIALQGVRRAAPALGERVAVIGLGLIGQLTVQLLRANGCQVFGMDLDAARVARARLLGLDDGASSAAEFERIVRDRTNGQGADATLLTAATSSDAVINLGMEVTRRRGRVVIVGDVGLHVERAAFYRKEIDLLMSTSYGPGRYDAAYEQGGADYPFAHVRWTLNRNLQAFLELVAAGRVNVAALIDRTVGVDDAKAAYHDLMARDGDRPLGVLLHYPDEARPLAEPPDATRITIRGHRVPAGRPLNYALVGVGAFGTSMLVPQIAKRPDALFLRAVVSRNTTLGGNFARAQQVEVLATEIGDVLSDTAIDAVVIATRHDRHARQAAEALRAGKHVFVEKPLALTWPELESVSSAASAANAGTLMVGFNRRFSPAIQRIAAELADRRTPIMVTYRLNGGYIPHDHWIQTAEGGGRNLGEACHMYDVFRFLARSPVATIQAAAIDPAPSSPHLRTNNFSATLTYQDGSVAQLLYTALGPKKGLAKERIEVFADGDALVVDDFCRLTRASTGDVLWQSDAPDKGHEAEIARWADGLVAGREAPIPVEELLETAAVALTIEDLLAGRDASGH